MLLKVGVFLLLLSGLACVSSGKFRNLQSEKDEAESVWQADRKRLDTTNQNLSDRNQQLNDELIRQNILLSELLNDKIILEKEVASLQNRLASLSSESQSLEAQLNEELERKNENLQAKEARLNRIINWFLQHQANLNQVSARLGELMMGYKEDEIDWYFTESRLDIVLYQGFLSSSQRRLTDKAMAALSRLALIIAEFPSLDIFVEGHTDNSPSGIHEALNLSTQRAVTIGAYLVEEGGLNGNQLTVCGRGSYFPRVSNQTPAGRALNNRVEISLRPPYRQILEFLEE